MDVNLHNGNYYVIDCGPTRFIIWRRLRPRDSATSLTKLHFALDSLKNFWIRGESTYNFAAHTSDQEMALSSDATAASRELLPRSSIL